MHFFFLVSFFILFSSFAQSQTTDTNSVAYLMDDGKISSARNIVKVNLVSPIIGDLPFYYERIVGKYFGLEAGAGILLPFYGPEGLGLFYEDQEIIDPVSGYSLWFQPKLYLLGKAPQYSYMGFQYRKRHYNLKSKQEIEYLDLTLNFGFQFYLWKRLMLDYNLGIGFRQRKYPVYHVDNGREGLIGIAMPLNLRLGFVF
jgi:hypothetical protein